MTNVTTLIGRTIHAVGPKKVARLWGLSLGYVYAIARDPADPNHPDQSGTDTDCDTRRRDLLEAAAAHPRHRPLLKEWRLRDEAFYARLLDNDDPDPITDQRVIALSADCSDENGESVAASVRAAMASDDVELWREALAEVTQAEAAKHRLGLAITRRLEGLEEGTLPLARRTG